MSTKPAAGLTRSKVDKTRQQVVFILVQYRFHFVPVALLDTGRRQPPGSSANQGFDAVQNQNQPDVGVDGVVGGYDAEAGGGTLQPPMQPQQPPMPLPNPVLRILNRPYDWDKRSLSYLGSFQARACSACCYCFCGQYWV